MSTWFLDGTEHRERVLVDLVTGVLFYSSIAGSCDGRGCLYMGLVRTDLTGVNAVIQALVCCLHPVLYGDIRENSPRLFELMCRLLVPSTVSLPGVELVREVQSFFVDHRISLCGSDVRGVGGKFDFLIGLCGVRVKGLFSFRVVTECCGLELVCEKGLGRVCRGSDWSLSEWCTVSCTCGRLSKFAVKKPGVCLLVRAEGGTLTAPLELDLRDLVTIDTPGRFLYDLKATVVRTMTNRYVCCSLRSRSGESGGAWWHFDDEVVESISPDEVSSTTGVVLMVYVLREWPSIDERVGLCMSLVDVHWKRPVGVVGGNVLRGSNEVNVCHYVTSTM